MKHHPGTIFLSAVLLTLSANVAFADDWQVRRLAQQLENVSDQLADETRNQRGYSSVSHQAKQLSNKADQLADSAGKQRSTAYQRGVFADLTRNFRNLETAYLRAASNYSSYYSDYSFERIANLHSLLSQELYYGDGYYAEPYPYRYSTIIPAPVPPRVYIAPPPITIYERRESRDYSRNADRYDHRSPVLERQRQREYTRDRDRFAGRRDGG